MKGSFAATAAALAVGAYAQAAVQYSTITIDECPTSSYASMVTITNGVTVTYCPECEGSPPTGAPPPGGPPYGPPPSGGPPPPSGGPPPPGHTTVYTTVYMSYCTTASTLTPVTYTVTESCTESTPTWTPGPSHIPPGFTTGVVTCGSCATTPMEVTITQPCGCEATNGVPVPPKPTGYTPGTSAVTQIPDGQPQAPTLNPPAQPSPSKPVSQIPDGQPQAPTLNPPAQPSPSKPVSQIPDGQPQAPTINPPSQPSASNPVTQIPDGQPQAPTSMSTKGATTTVATCANPPCKAGQPGPSGPVFNGGASTLVQTHFGVFSYSALALLVGVFALAL